MDRTSVQFVSVRVRTKVQDRTSATLYMSGRYLYSRSVPYHFTQSAARTMMWYIPVRRWSWQELAGVGRGWFGSDIGGPSVVHVVDRQPNNNPQPCSSACLTQVPPHRPDDIPHSPKSFTEVHLKNTTMTRHQLLFVLAINISPRSLFSILQMKA